MIRNHCILITTSVFNREALTIISVYFTDWLIPNMEFFVSRGGLISSLSSSFSIVDLAGFFFMPLFGSVFPWWIALLARIEPYALLLFPLRVDNTLLHWSVSVLAMSQSLFF